MASVGPQNPTAATTIAGPGIDWSNATNVLSSNDSYSTASTFGPVNATERLRVTGFDFSAIPDGSTIDGVVVEIERSVTSTSGSPRDSSIYLCKATVQAGSNKASGTTWPTTDAYATYGGVADLWGTTLTTADVKDSGFGILIAGQITGKASTTFRVDHVRITIYYTASGGTGIVITVHHRKQQKAQ